jgi:hypothetical protein
MGEAVPLDPAAVVIGEDTFTALLAHRGESSPLTARHDAAVLAANLADPAALGVIATLEHGQTDISSNLFIVLRDPALSPDGEIEGRNAFVAAVELSGPVPWFGRSSRLALLSGRSGGGCRNVPRGCRPIFATRSRGAVPLRFSSSRADTAGLPPTVLLNLESGAGPPNASGRHPHLLVFGTNPTQQPSAYECHTPVGWDECSDEPRTAGPGRAKPARTAPLPRNAILLGERDFMKALSLKEPGPVGEHDVPAMRRLLTLANSDEALGISGRYNEAKAFSGELFAVARDPVLMPDGRVMATEYYLAAVKLSGTGSWQATLPEVGLRGEIPAVADGFCGLVSTPGEVPRCDREPCGPWIIPLNGGIPERGAPGPPSGPGVGPAGYSVEGGEPRFGADRWPAGKRITLRVPTFEAGRQGLPDLSAIACSDHWPPPERTPNPGPPGVEVCNGVDDNGDGNIDENDVCANRDTQCTCAPRTCADLGATCGVVHDGCSQLLTCGPPCP